MEPPSRRDSESMRDEMVKVLKAVPSISEHDIIRGQFPGYRDGWFSSIFVMLGAESPTEPG
jgi:glucose-6-phosphate 1-dehydrogenase